MKGRMPKMSIQITKEKFDEYEKIRRQIDETTSDYDKEKLQERLAKLVGGIAQIQVGGATETEVKEKKSRFEDARSATQAALEEGILPGGGTAGGLPGHGLLPGGGP